MATRAVAKFIRITPRKCRRVVDLVRGKYVDEALAILQFMPQRAAKQVRKVVTSAAANAENNEGLDREDLRITLAMVDEGPTWKRIKPRAMGRAYAILKRTSHITIAVDEGPPRQQKPGRRPRMQVRRA